MNGREAEIGHRVGRHLSYLFMLKMDLALELGGG
jgi:hypothetical protein